MTVIERSALLPHPAEQVFDLVADIERYPEFLDGCVGAEIHERGDEIVTATLMLSRAGISHGFTTRNTMQRPERIELALVDGRLILSRGNGCFGHWVMQPARHRCVFTLSSLAGWLAWLQENYSTALRWIWLML